MRQPTSIDLFAGCGGLSLGLESAGVQPLLAVELSPMAAETHFKNFHLRGKSWDQDLWEGVLEAAKQRAYKQQIASGTLIGNVTELAED